MWMKYRRIKLDEKWWMIETIMRIIKKCKKCHYLRLKNSGEDKKINSKLVQGGL
jgi:hypothetical protein